MKLLFKSSILPITGLMIACAGAVWSEPLSVTNHLTNPQKLLPAPPSVAEGEARLFEEMRMHGASAETLLVQKEVFHLMDSGVDVSSWEGWKRHYNAEMLNPPVVFDLRDAITNDFTAPITAARSFWRAIYAGDSKTLLEHSDESSMEWLKKQVGVDRNVKRQTYAFFTNITRVTILLTASNRLEGKNYALVFSRAEESTNPKNGRVAFRVMIFKKENNLYEHTCELLLSPFGMVVGAAGVSDPSLKPYPKFYEAAKLSSFPTNFYTLE